MTEAPRRLPVIRRATLAFVLCLLSCTFASAQSGEPLRPEWCRELPRPEYAKLERVKAVDDWFEVYRVRPGVFAIYEPHQFEEVISYLILGDQRAMLFDTGMGIGRISNVVAGLTKLPVTVLNSHTHFDHTGGNAEFSDILAEDTPFTRANEKGQSNQYSQDALAAGRICGKLPANIQADSYAIRPYHVSRRVKDGEHIQLGGRELQVIFTPGHTPDSLCLLDAKNQLLFTATRSIRGRFISSLRKRTLMLIADRSPNWRNSNPNCSCFCPPTMSRRRSRSFSGVLPMPCRKSIRDL